MKYYIECQKSVGLGSCSLADPVPHRQVGGALTSELFSLVALRLPPLCGSLLSQGRCFSTSRRDAAELLCSDG